MIDVPLRSSPAGILPRPVTRRSLQVALAGPLTALTAPGGGEVQMAATAQNLRDADVRASLWRPWEEPLAEFDCVHLFGSKPEHLHLAAAARGLGIPVVLSTIAWFDLAGYCREPRGVFRRAANGFKFLARAALPALPSWRRRLYHEVDLLLPNSQAEAEQLVRYFGVPRQRIHVVPNGAEGRFAFPGRSRLPAEISKPGFVLYPGRIEPRKNQLGFLRAMRGSGERIVVLGDAVPGHEDYLRACRAAADARVTFLGRVSHDDPRLESLYAACGALALCSWFETPGLVALEAGMSGVPLVLPEAGSAREYFGDLAQYVRPHDLAGIRRAVLAAQQQGRSSELAARVRQQFTWQVAAERTKEAYEHVV